MIKRLSLIALGMLLALLVLPGSVLAHAHLIRADLAPDSHLRVSVGTVRFWFDEPLNAALSHVAILNRQGRQVNADTGVLNPTNNDELDVTVPTLPDGVYSVRWTSASAQDGHVLHGYYLFTAGGPGAVSPPSTPTTLAGSDGAALDFSGVVVALAHWLVLAASALWTGAVALEVLVLAPARRHSRHDQVGLAASGSCRARALIQLGLLATLPASVLELAAQAYAAAGDWSGPVSTEVLSNLLGTQYGIYLGVRAVLVGLALPVVGNAIHGGSGVLRLIGARQSAATVQPAGFMTAGILTLLGLAYLLALALSGHAGAVQHMAITSVLLDWLHLVAMAVWVGGMAAIALALVPQREWRRELLDLLDRFSPAANLAVLTAAATGMFNAQVRISSLGTLIGTLYGRLLLAKLAVIAAIMAVSATHVWITRPRLRAQVLELSSHATARAYRSLVARLRLEAALGAVVLLCVALMGQVAPSASAFNATVVQVAGDPGSALTGGPIAATGTVGDLTVSLQINPADIGQAQLAATVTERGHVVTDGQVRIKLTMPADAALGATFVETTAAAGRYSGTGDLVQEGLWRADVLVRTHRDPGEFRDMPIVFIASPEPAVLSPPATDTGDGPATLRLSSTPGAAAAVMVRLHPGLQVRYLVTMQDMSPQEFGARGETNGWYTGVIVPPMDGYMNLAVQVHEATAWRTVRMAVCEVDGAYGMHLLL